jgi:hypothetical protein
VKLTTYLLVTELRMYGVLPPLPRHGALLRSRDVFTIRKEKVPFFRPVAREKMRKLYGTPVPPESYTIPEYGVLTILCDVW